MAKKLFISYSHADAELLERLHKHLAQLKRDGVISEWYDREIHAGGKIDEEVGAALASSDIFIACASPDYIASNYCYERELTTALEREAAGDLVIVPVIFEPSEWLETPLQKFKAVPRDGKAVSEHTNPNVALLDVATELRRLVASLGAPIETKSMPPGGPAQATSAVAPSRYRVKREHDALHKRDFIEAAFNEIYKFFESSVAEIASVPDIEARLTPISGDRFSCTIINRGLRRGFETLHVRRGGSLGAIDILYGERYATNTSNGGFSIDSDDYQLYLKPLMFNLSQMEKRLTAKEAAQMLWDDLLSKVGIGYA